MRSSRLCPFFFPSVHTVFNLRPQADLRLRGRGAYRTGRHEPRQEAEAEGRL
jgi:hypothetical protein